MREEEDTQVSGAPQGCEGVAYKGALYYSGATRWEKEQWHSGGYVFGEMGKTLDQLKENGLE